MGVKVDGHDAKVQWGRSRPKKKAIEEGGGAQTAISERELESTGK